MTRYSSGSWTSDAGGGILPDMYEFEGLKFVRPMARVGECIAIIIETKDRGRIIETDVRRNITYPDPNFIPAEWDRRK